MELNKNSEEENISSDKGKNKKDTSIQSTIESDQSLKPCHRFKFMDTTDSSRV